MEPLRRWNIAVGNFFFRYRNGLFPVLFALAGLLGRPRLLGGDPGLDQAVVRSGVFVALAGEAVRLITIGYEYIERGGKAGKVYASRLVQGGVYALNRNPMYVGNILIATGVVMVFGAPLLFMVVLPLFLFIYQAIIAAEEAYLRRQFGAEYDQYCARVPRFLPAVHRAGRALRGLAYDWKRAVRKDLSTIAGLLLGLIALPVWRLVWLEGWDAVRRTAPRALGAFCGVLAVYAALAHLKRRRIFFYNE